jgi:hypothetical protein
MASSPLLLALAMVASSFFLAVSGQKFNAIYSFGDSMSDTGNLCVNGPPAGLTLTQPPYGETFFGRATCRCSDGRLVVDFLGMSIRSPPRFEPAIFPPKTEQLLCFKALVRHMT